MSLVYMCPECHEEMTLQEDKHVCEKCEASFTLDEAANLFEEGKLIGVSLDESEITLKDVETIVVEGEDIAEKVRSFVFENTDLSEDVAEKAAMFMEAAITSQVKEIANLMEQQKAEEVNLRAQAIATELFEQVDDYLNVVVNEWLEENRLAIETGVKAEMNQAFIEGLSSLFAEHYVAVPDERWDIVDGLAAKVKELEESLSAEIDNKAKVVKQLDEMKKQRALDEAVAELPATRAETVRQLAEDLSEGLSLDEYVERVEAFVATVSKSNNSNGNAVNAINEGADEHNSKAESEANDPISAAVKLLRTGS